MKVRAGHTANADPRIMTPYGPFLDLRNLARERHSKAAALPQYEVYRPSRYSETERPPGQVTIEQRGAGGAPRMDKTPAWSKAVTL